MSTVSLISVVVVNEEREMCELWQKMIDMTPGMTCPSYAMTSLMGIDMVKEFVPDIVLLSMTLQDESVTTTAQQILAIQDDTLIMMFSADGSQQEAALKAGAVDFFELPIEPDRLIKAILKVYKSHRK